VAEVCIFTFPSTHAALQAEALSEEAGLKIRMIPVPRALSSDCSMGMETSVEAESAAKELLVKGDVEHGSVRWER
jgi:hypothetical protein